MKRQILPRIVILVVLCIGTGCISACSRSSDSEAGGGDIIELVNGRWFDGRQFQAKTFYSNCGLLQRTRPPIVHEVKDLEGGFVVPPFAEAHNHNIEGVWNVDEVIQGYLEAGVFYVKIQGNVHELSSKILGNLNSPTTVDVVFANAVLTGSGGHPLSLYEDVLRESWYGTHMGNLPRGWFNGRSYLQVDSINDLNQVWPDIVATKPDFIKTILSYSEDFEDNRHNNSQWVRKGLDPRLLRVIVENAHREGLSVTTHVETAADFHHAVESGVDEIAHLPGYYIHAQDQAYRAKIDETDARNAGIKDIVVVTTTVLSTSILHDRSLLPLVQKIQKQNLKLLQEHNVRLAIGSDHSDTSVPEALYIHDLGVFDNLTLLKIWCETTPQTIFPDRKIGRLEAGYEASFLVLEDNPIEDFNAVQKIRLRVKHGHVISTVD